MMPPVPGEGGRTLEYEATVTWTGDRGEGTRTYTAYARDHEIQVPGRPPIPASSDPAFRGDPARYSPEDLLVASLSGCHMLWYLHLCADAGVVVVGYRDRARGRMKLERDGSGRFTEVVLRPQVAVMDASTRELARELHGRAHELCFIAGSVSFPVRVEPAVTTAGDGTEPGG